MARTPPKFWSPARIKQHREEQARLRAVRAAQRKAKGGRKSPPTARSSHTRSSHTRSSRNTRSISSEHTADAADVARLLTREGTSSILGSSFGSTGFSSFKAHGKLNGEDLDEAMMQGRRDMLFPSTSREATRKTPTSTSRQLLSLRGISENLKRNSYAVVSHGTRAKQQQQPPRRGSSARGRLQGKRRKFVPLRRVRNPERVEAVVIGDVGSFGAGGGGGGGGSTSSSSSKGRSLPHVYVSPDSDAVRMLVNVARSPLPPKPSRHGPPTTPLQRAKSLEKAVRRMVRSLRPKNVRCARGTRRGFGGRCYSPTMLKLLQRVREQIKVLRAHERNLAMLRKLRKGRTLAASVKRSLAKTYGAREVRKIAAKKMTLPRGAKLERIPLRKVKGRTVYKYRLRR